MDFVVTAAITAVSMCTRKIKTPFFLTRKGHKTEYSSVSTKTEGLITTLVLQL